MYKTNKDELNEIKEKVQESILLAEHSSVNDTQVLIEKFHEIKEKVDFIKKDIVPEEILDKVVVEVEEFVQPMPVEYKRSLWQNIKEKLSFFVSRFMSKKNVTE